MKKNPEELKQEFLDFEISQPLVKKNQMALNPKNKKGFNVKEYGKKFISTFLIFTGAYLIYASSLTVFHVFIAHLADISKPLTVFLVFIIGLILTISGVGRLKRSSDLLLCLSIPFMSLILGFFFMLAPANLHGRLFGGYSLFFFPLILFVFYYLKEHFASSLNKLNFP